MYQSMLSTWLGRRRTVRKPRPLRSTRLSCTSLEERDVPSFSGAIYTTLADGTKVNANIYELRSDVYLNGGPQNLNSPGLPDGVYFFQVTDPSGATLLSLDDAIYRQVLVFNGAIFGVPSVTDLTNAPNEAAYLAEAGNLSVNDVIPYLHVPGSLNIANGSCSDSTTWLRISSL